MQIQLPEVFCKMDVLRNFAKLTGKPVPETLFAGQTRPATLLKKDTLAQLFSCEFYKISKSTFFNRTPPDDVF